MRLEEEKRRFKKQTYEYIHSMFYRVNPTYPDGSWGKLFNLEDGNANPYDIGNSGYYDPIIALVEEMHRYKESRKYDYERLYYENSIQNDVPAYGLFDEYQEKNFYDLRGHIIWQRDHAVKIGDGNTNPARRCVNRTLDWINEKIRILNEWGV